MERRGSSPAMSSQDEGMSDDKVQEFLDPKNQRARFSTMRKSPTPITELKTRLLAANLGGGGTGSPVKSGIIKKSGEQPVDDILGGHSDPSKGDGEVSLREADQVSPPAVEKQDTEHITEAALNSGNRRAANEDNLKQVNFSSVHIRFKPERTLPLEVAEAKVPKRSKTEIGLLRSPSHPESLNQKKRRRLSSARRMQQALTNVEKREINSNTADQIVSLEVEGEPTFMKVSELVNDDQAKNQSKARGDSRSGLQSPAVAGQQEKVLDTIFQGKGKGQKV